MDTPAKVALGGGLLSTLAVGGMVTAAVLATSAAVVVADPAAPAAAATGLARFDGCASLRSWYVEHTVDQVGPWGWGGRTWPMLRRDGAVADATAPAAGYGRTEIGVGSGPTGTNTQEVGVDEPDVAKTDGHLVVRLDGGTRLVLTDVSGEHARQVADWRLPGTAVGDGLLLVGDHVLLTGVARPIGRDAPGLAAPRTEVYDVDVSDPARPRLAQRTTWSGRSLSVRQYGDTVRLVASLGLPSLPFVHPEPGSLTEDRAEQRNRAIVRSARIEDWIPGLACDQVFHPRDWSGPDTVVVRTFHPGAADEASAVAVAGGGSAVYSSRDRLYVTSTEWSGGPVLMDHAGPRLGPGPVRPQLKTRTHIHAFALEDDATRYVASGTVTGTIRDRWSLDEHDGHLRVALSWPARTGDTRENGLVVLDEQEGRLVPVGELGGLGVGESIQSVRWFDDLAVVVTFRQTDPLYTIDLSDPTRPRRLGALTLPGFSAYLHPIGQDRLLGLGTDADLEGQTLGAQAAVLDISDPGRARQVGKVTFGPGSSLDATVDPHAFTWLPQAHSAVVGLQDRRTGQEPQMVLLHVAEDGTLAVHDLPAVGGWIQRALPLADGRVALVGSTVRLLDVTG